MRILFPLSLCLMSFVSNAADTKFGGIVLLQPDFVLQEKGINVQDFANFIRAVQAQTEKEWKTENLPSSTGFLVVAVREGKKVNSWLDMEPAIPAEVEKRTRQLLSASEGFHVSRGTVVFAIKTSVNGASETSRQTPMPKEWQAAMKSRLLPVETENLVKLVWP